LHSVAIGVIQILGGRVMGGLAATTLGLTLTATIASRLFSLHPLHCASLPHRRQVLVRPRGKWRMGEGRGAGDAGGSSQTEDDWTQPAAAVESSAMPESVLASSSGKAAASAASAIQFLSLCQRLKVSNCNSVVSVSPWVLGELSHSSNQFGH